MNQTITSRIAALRDAMHARGLAACLIPTADPHMSEYVPEHWQARVRFSGFTGSAGSLLVAGDFAGLWTDSRYFGQAERQLEGTGIALMRIGQKDTPSQGQWLEHHLGDGDVVAIAGDSVSVAGQRRLAAGLEAIGATLRTDLDVPAMAWQDRPALPHAPVVELPIDYAISSRSDRLARVRKAMADVPATHHLVSTLDDIAWILNLRGSDIDYNPIFLAHLVVGKDGCELFVDASRIGDDVQKSLAADNVTLHGYGDIRPYLAALPDGSRLLFDPAHVAVSTVAGLSDGVTCIELPNPSTAMKAVKSDAQLDHVRAVMREDGAALVKGFHEVEKRLAAGREVTELDVDVILREARAARPGFVSESFSTIAAYMENGALPHYSATLESFKTLAADGLLLVDSGGQYLGGTTDITRVWAFGTTTTEQRHDYTIVLKGMIDLSMARFPEGASGPQLDALARAPIWADNADFGHGTGHGVGYFLNVHEGPQSIRPPRAGAPLVALEPGMITSIEPGLYKPGRHGIRHENLAAVVPAGESEFGRFFAFETLTLCPFDTRAVDASLLTDAERTWLNAYHARVEEQLAPLLDDDDKAWLHARCRPLA